MSEEIEIGNGVSQACILSPSMFNAYSEIMMEEATGICRHGVGKHKSK